MADLGKAYVQIVPSAKGITGKIKQAIGGDVSDAGKGAGESFAKNFGGVLKKGIAVLGIGKALKDSISEGAELQQNLGGTEAVFGKYASKIQTMAKDAYKSMGSSASEYMATANKMGSLFQGSGISQVKSLDMTSQAIQRAADVASVMGVDMDMAMESISGMAKGNLTMMDNLGVSMNATTLKAYALEKGMNFDWNTASNAEKAELAMKMFMDRTSQYAGNFARESEETLSGSIGMVKASYKDLMASLALGRDVGPAMANLARSASTALFKNLIPAVGNVIKSLPIAFRSAVAVIGPMISKEFSSIVANPQEIGSKIKVTITKALQGLGDIGAQLPDLASRIPDVLKGMAGVIATSLQGVFDGVMSSMPDFISWITTQAQALASALPAVVSDLWTSLSSYVASLDVYAVMDSATSKVTAFLMNNLPGLMSAAITKGVPTLMRLIVKVITTLGPILISASSQVLLNAGKIILATVAGFVKGLGKTVVDALAGLAGMIIEALAGMWDDIAGGTKSAIGGIKSAIVEELAPIKEVLSKAWKGLKQVSASVWNGVKNVAMNPIRALLAFLRSEVRAIKAIWDGLKIIKTKVAQAFRGARDSALKPLNALRDRVRGAIEKIKSYFPIRLGNLFSGFKTPHINVTYGSISALGKTIRYPKGFDVKWYKKAMQNPYVFNGKTVFGAGDARDEMLYSRSKLLRDIKAATSQKAEVTQNNTITLYANAGESPEAFGRRVADEIIRRTRVA